jgi:hypothetical protein
MTPKAHVRQEVPSVPLPIAAPARPVLTDDPDRLHQELVGELAYPLYVERGCIDGHDLQDWFDAEAILKQRILAAWRREAGAYKFARRASFATCAKVRQSGSIR